MGIIRPYRPNLAELAVYRPFLERFELSFYLCGIEQAECARTLASMGLGKAELVCYRSYTDWVSWSPLQRAIDFRVGFGSIMLSHVGLLARHDYVNIVDPIYAFAGQTLSVLRPNQKLVVVRWEHLPDRYDRIWAARRRSRRVLARADYVLCVSGAARLTLRLPEGFSGRVAQIYPGIDLRGVEASGIRRPTNRPVVLFVGRLQWTKGLHLLIEALEIVRRERGDAPELRVIGDGDARPYHLRAEELGIEHSVRFLGRLPNEAVRRLMRDADVFCLPSLPSPTWAEQFGFALVEAMAHALPVVAFDTGVIRDVCGPYGVYASAGNASSLAESLMMALRDPSAARERGEHLRHRAFAEFDSDRQGQKMLEWLT